MSPKIALVRKQGWEKKEEKDMAGTTKEDAANWKLWIHRKEAE